MGSFSLFVTLLMLSTMASANSIVHEMERIKGGQQASRRSRDFQGLAFINKASNPKDSTICSVVLVDKDWALAPNSCALREGTEIYFGLTRWCSGDQYEFDSGYEQRTVKQIITRPRTADSANNMQHPLILAELSSPITETEYIRYAYLPQHHPKGGEKFHITGWGQTQEYGKMTCVLREASAKVLSDEDCKAAQGGRKTLRGDEVCVLTEGNKEAGCNGDIGAPLFKENGVYGVMLKNTGCGFSTYPQLYATTDTELEWIKATIKEKTDGTIWIG